MPPVVSVERLGGGIEMLGALGNTDEFGLHWNRQQHYVGPVFTYALSQVWSVRVEPAIGLSAVSDRFVLRMGVAYSMDRVAHRLGSLF